MKRVHIVGRKNSGKTTLVVDLIREFTARGYRTGSIKHTHHSHELDTPGKDSHRHREAGSAAVGILAANMNAIFWPQDSRCSVQDKYARFDAMMRDCDVVLVEGDSRARPAVKIEVYRSENGNPDDLMAATDKAIVSVVTDGSVDIDLPVWPRSDVGGIVEKLIALLDLPAREPL